jgi:hypothetical protein
VAGREKSGTVEGRSRVVNSVDLTPVPVLVDSRFTEVSSLTLHTLRFTVHGYLQALAGGKDSGAVERGRRVVDSENV